MMGPLAAIQSVIFKSFQFSGRATRAEYWWWALFQVIAISLCVWIDFIRHLSSHTTPPPLNPIEWASFVFAILTLPANLSVMVRRLHDTGRSGFWYFITLVPLIGGIWFFVLMLLPSQRDDNIYGPPWHDHSTWAGKSEGKKDPMQAYAILDRLQDGPNEAAIAARKEEVREYYRTRVLQAPAG